MRRFIIIAALTLTLCGCRGYIGGFDDSNLKFSQLVLMNRSSREVTLLIARSQWADPQDTIRLEAENGLWKKTVNKEYYSSNLSDARIQIILKDGRKVFLDDMTRDFVYNPCRAGGVTDLYDNQARYFVYEFNDNVLDSLDAFLTRRQVFPMMTTIQPSNVSSSHSVHGSSETLIADIFMMPQLRGKLGLGTLVYQETDEIGSMRIAEECRFVPQHTVTRIQHDYASIPLRACTSYSNIETLRKLGLAHFGCDFAELTGRGDSRMERFSGIIFSNTEIYETETFTDDTLSAEVSAFMEDSTEEIGIVNMIHHGKCMILLAEADCSKNLLYNFVEHRNSGGYYDLDEVDCYLLTLDPDGNFRCTKGGRELIDIYCDSLDSQPTLPLSFRMSSDLKNIACLHVHDIDVTGM